MRVAALTLLVALLVGCTGTATQENSTTAAPEPSTQSQSLTELFPEADGPRVPRPKELLGIWKVVNPAEPPAGAWTETYSKISFRNIDDEPFRPKGFTPTPLFSLTIGAAIECNFASGPLAVAADGRAGTDPNSWLTTTMGCEGEFPYSFYDKVDRLAIDEAGYLWIANSDGVFKAKKTKRSN